MASSTPRRKPTICRRRSRWTRCPTASTNHLLSRAASVARSRRELLTRQQRGFRVALRQRADAGGRSFHRRRRSRDHLPEDSVKLIAHNEPRDQFLSVPLLRLRRAATGGFELDDTFVPPSLSIDASPILHPAAAPPARRAAGQGQRAVRPSPRAEPSNVIEFRSGDIASFWLLHTASAAFASLAHSVPAPGAASRAPVRGAAELAGALMTFSKSWTLADLPAYQHDDPGPALREARPRSCANCSTP